MSMNNNYRLKSELIRERLRVEMRKQAWLIVKLGVSPSLIRLMLDEGHVPKQETLEALAKLINVKVEDLLVKHGADDDQA